MPFFIAVDRKKLQRFGYIRSGMSRSTAVCSCNVFAKLYIEHRISKEQHRKIRQLHHPQSETIGGIMARLKKSSSIKHQYFDWMMNADISGPDPIHARPDSIRLSSYSSKSLHVK